MDLIITAKCWIALLAMICCFQIVAGFTIKDKTQNGPQLHLQKRSASDDYVREITNNIRLAQSLQNSWPHLPRYISPSSSAEEADEFISPSSPIVRDADSDDVDEVDDDEDNDKRKTLDDALDVIAAAMTYPQDQGSSPPGLLDNAPPVSTRVKVLTVPAKRQQAWHTPYGKRSSAASQEGILSPAAAYLLKASQTHHRHPAVFDAGLQYDLGYAGSSNPKYDDADDAAQRASGQPSIAFQLLPAAATAGGNKAARTSASASSYSADDVVKAPFMQKRQQFWYTEFGKRSQKPRFS